MVYVDKLTVLKLQRRFMPRTINEQEHKDLDDPPISLKVGRFLRKRVYRPLSPKVLRPKTRRVLQKITGKSFLQN